MARWSILAATIGAALLLFSFVPTPAAHTASDNTVARGTALFAAKGCAQCHAHAAIAGSGQFGGPDAPDLSQHPLDPTYLRRWLADPAAVKPGTTMPTLGLSDEEITALVAFLNSYTPSMQ